MDRRIGSRVVSFAAAASVALSPMKVTAESTGVASVPSVPSPTVSTAALKKCVVKAMRAIARPNMGPDVSTGFELNAAFNLVKDAPPMKIPPNNGTLAITYGVIDNQDTKGKLVITYQDDGGKGEDAMTQARIIVNLDKWFYDMDQPVMGDATRQEVMFKTQQNALLVLGAVKTACAPQ